MLPLEQIESQFTYLTNSMLQCVFRKSAVAQLVKKALTFMEPKITVFTRVSHWIIHAIFLHFTSLRYILSSFTTPQSHNWSHSFRFSD
jgi:hypothetical protein